LIDAQIMAPNRNSIGYSGYRQIEFISDSTQINSKKIKRWYYLATNRLNVNMVLSNIIFLFLLVLVV